MKFALNVPNMGVCSSPQTSIELANAAETAGWDGFFVWDCIDAHMDDPRNAPACDPWIALAGIGAHTQRIRLGPIITPLTRRRPWKVARETVTLDWLSNGRLTLPVGLGAVDEGGFWKVGEETDRRIRAERLDESLAILDGLWSGQPFCFNGRHYHLEEMTFLPRPLQQPRIPIWVVGAWPRPQSMRRALRYDGLMTAVKPKDGPDRSPAPADIRQIGEYIAAHRPASAPPFDIIMESETPGDPAQAAEIVAPFAEAGVTWWMESVWWWFYRSPGEAGPLLERIQQGPPAL